MEFELKTGAQGHVYFPKNIRKMLGNRITILPNSCAAALYPEGSNLQAVISSLELIIQDLELRSCQRRRANL